MYGMRFVHHVVLLFLIVSAGSLVAQVPDETADQTGDLPGEPTAPQAVRDSTPPETEVWRETLLYGINSEVAELLPRLTRERRDELAPEVEELFNTATDRRVLQAAAEYLRALELPGGHQRAFLLVQEYFDRPSDLITTILGYLRETKATPDEETREILREISRMEPPARAVAALRLYAAGTTDIEELVDLYRETLIPEDVQGQILVELGTRGDPRAFEFVAEIIGEDEEATTVLQRYAIDTLGKLGDERAIPIILRQLDSSDSMTRAYAVNALTGFDTVETNRAILASLRDQFWRVRVAALQTIAERALEEALPAVLYMMRRDPERRVRLEAIRTVGKLDDDRGWDVLLERMADARTNLEERSAMIDVAIRSNASRAVPAILEIVQTEWDKSNSRVLDAIGRTVSTAEDRALAPVVEQLLHHPNFIIQIYGARAAGRNTFSQYSEQLRALSEDGVHRMIRDAASAALQRL